MNHTMFKSNQEFKKQQKVIRRKADNFSKFKVMKQQFEAFQMEQQDRQLDIDDTKGPNVPAYYQISTSLM